MVFLAKTTSLYNPFFTWLCLYNEFLGDFAQNEDDPKNEDNHNNNDNLKDDTKNEGDLKDEGQPKNEDNLKFKSPQK